MTALLTATVPTPFGPLAIIAEPDAEGTVVASGFSPLADVKARLDVETQARGFRPAGPKTAMPARDAATKWAAGDIAALTSVPVRQTGGPFQVKVWEAMRDIEPGTTVSYTELAARAGNPKAVRAVGSSCSRNLVAPFVPCHRVVASSGRLGGYYWGVPMKRKILEFEGAISAE